MYNCRAQTEIILSLLCLPNREVPNIVNYADFCLLLKDAYDEKFGKMTSKNFVYIFFSIDMEI